MQDAPSDPFRLLTALSEIAGNVVVRLDSAGRVEWISQRGVAFLGLDAVAVIGQSWFAVAGAREDRDKTGLPPPERVEYELPTAAGPRRVRWSGIVVDVPASSPAMLGILQDVTDRDVAEQTVDRLTGRLESMVRDRTRTLNRMNRELIMEVADRRQAEAAMALAKREAEAASQAKSEFLANVGHEIRTPMNGILGMAQLLASTTLDDDQRSYLHDIESSAASLLKLIQNILDLSILESGRLELEWEPFDLREVLASVTSSLCEVAREKQLGLDVEIADETPLVLFGDVGRLLQVLRSLADNAVKFTRHGGVIISVRCDGAPLPPDQTHEYPRQELLFSVSDTGIGIRAEDVGRIFESFTQADGSATRRFGGMGLGLAIARRLVERMGGSLTVQSELGRGSVFSFTSVFGLERAQEFPRFVRDSSPPFECSGE